MLRGGSSFSNSAHSDSHSQFWLGTSQGGWAIPGALGSCDFLSCLGDRFLGWARAVVSKSWGLANPPSIDVFLPGDALSGSSIRNFQDHVPGFPEVEAAAGMSPGELGQSAVNAWVWRCWAFRQPSGGVGSEGPDLHRLGAGEEELIASSKACGLPSHLWGTLAPSILGGPNMTPVNRPGTTRPWFLESLGKKVSSSPPSPVPLVGGFWLTSGLDACTPWLFSGSSSVSSSEESTSRIASCFCSDSRRSARSCRRVPRAREGAGCSTPFPGSAPFPESTALVPTTSRGLASLGGSSFFSSQWGRSRPCL